MNKKPFSRQYWLSVTAFYLFYFLVSQLRAEDRILWQGVNGKVVWTNVGSGQATDAVFWENTQGKSSQIIASNGRFGFEKALRAGDQICILGGDTLGILYYWCFEAEGEVWKQSHKAYLGSVNAFKPRVTTFELEGIDDIRAFNQDASDKRAKVTVEVTSIPLCPDSPEELWRLVLVNGEILRPNVGIQGAIWDQPLDKIKKDHEARLRAASRTPTENKSADISIHAGTSALVNSPANSEQALRAKPQTSNLMLFIAGGVILVGIVVLISEIKNKRKKP